VADRPERLGDTDVAAQRQVTEEVGGEGGSPGDVEVERDKRPGIGSEAEETLRPASSRRTTIARDKEGRRNP
jgi:hypothetical protein